LRKHFNIILLFVFGFINGGQTVSVDSVFFFPNSSSINQAKLECLNHCRKIAIEKVVPKKTLVAANSILEKMESDGNYKENAAFTSFHNSTSVGYIVDEKILEANPIAFVENGFRFKISYKAEVEIPSGERDPSNRIELWPESRSLNSGDLLTLNARSSIDGFVYILHFMPDLSVEIMFPNKYVPDNKLLKNEIKKFPDDERIKIRLTSIPGQSMTNETFYAIFCKTEIPDMEKLIAISSSEGRLSAGDSSFKEFQNILASVPLSYRSEAACQVIVVGEEGN